MVSICICPERKLAIIFASFVIIKIFVYGAREVAIIFTVSVGRSKRVITTIYTSSIPI